MSDVHVILGEPSDPLVRRRIVVWHRLEPGDVRTEGARDAPESPFLEAKVLEVAVSKAVHADLRRLAESKRKALAVTPSPFSQYEPAGMLIAGGGGTAFAGFFDWLRPPITWEWIGGVVAGVGVVLAVIARARLRAAQEEAKQRWAKDPDREEHDRLARELAHAWLAFAQKIRETGFHTEIRVAEGSSEPLRLSSIDPTPFEGATGFDPEDWLPTEGGGVRYETVHISGDVVTRVLPASQEIGESTDSKSADSKSADSKSADSKSTEPKSADSKSADSKSADSKSADSKSTEPKSVDPTSADSKPADPTSAAEPSDPTAADANETADPTAADSEPPRAEPADAESSATTDSAPVSKAARSGDG